MNVGIRMHVGFETRTTQHLPAQNTRETNSSKRQLLRHAIVIATSEPPSSFELRYIYPAEYLVYKPWERRESFSVDSRLVSDIGVGDQERDFSNLKLKSDLLIGKGD
jgi:hypothetical protein